MTWQEQEIEKVTKKRLEDEFKSQGEAWYANYVVAKNTIAKDLLPNIRAVEPGLTDHGPDHVKDVLFRAGQLLSDRLTKIPSQDLYILILSILFHDVGNIFKRDDHQKKISKVLCQCSVVPKQ